MSRRLFRDLVRYVPSFVIPIVGGVATTVIFSRLASPEELGTFLLVLALTHSIGAPSGFWIGQGLLRLYPAYVQAGRQVELVRAVSLLALLSGGLATLVVVALLWSGAVGVELPQVLLLPVALTVLLSQLTSWRFQLLQARFAVGRYSGLVAAYVVAKLIVPLVLFPALGALAALLWGIAIATVMERVALGVMDRRRDADPAGGATPGGARELWRICREVASFGLPLSVSEIGTQVLIYSDRYVIGALLGAAAVGLYSTNYSIGEKLFILVQAPLISAAHPQIMSEWERGNRDGAKALIRTATRWLILLGVPLVAFTAVRSRLISGVVLGEAFADGHLVLPISAASMLLWAASQYGHKCFELARNTWVITGAVVSAACVNVAMAIVLTAAMGYLGGAIATATGFGVYAAIVFFASRRLGAFPWSVPWRTAATAALGASGAAAVWAALVPEHLASVGDMAGLAGGGLAGLVVYALVVGWLGELPPLLGAASPLAPLVAGWRTRAGATKAGRDRA